MHKTEPETDIHARLDARVTEELRPELEVLRPVGSGAAARVYLAREPALGRQVAVKVLLRPSDNRVATRFEREARAAAAISHPCAVGVHRLGRLSDGSPYLVMQYVRGRSLAERLAGEGTLPPSEVRGLVGDIAGALSAAHAHGILHRDVRPANVLWDEQLNRFLLTDFGIAAMYESAMSDQERLTRTGELLGDIRYLSPQQLRGEPASPESDIYALAVTACEALCGRVPHEGGSKLDLVSARTAGRDVELPSELDSDPALAAMLSHCLSANAMRRPSAAAIEKLAAKNFASSDDADDTSTVRRLWRALRRRRMPEWVGSTIAAALVSLEVVDQLTDNSVLPAILYPITLATALAMIPVAAILAWFHGAKGGQRVTAIEIALLTCVFLLWGGMVASVFM